MTKKALIIVDAQYDFMEGGSLAVTGATKAMDLLTRFLSKEENIAQYDLIVTTQDWHISPGEHWAAEGETPDFNTSWPVHCAAETHGSEIYQSIKEQLEAINSIPKVPVKKGMYEAAYSGFEGISETSVEVDGVQIKNSTLKNILDSYHIDNVDVVGLATDYCVKSTALDAVKNGFKTNVIEDFCASVTLEPIDALKELMDNKVEIIKGEEK